MISLRPLLAAVLLVLASSCSQKPADLPKARGANVLLVTLDTTRADHIGAYGYPGARTPNIDALAREGVLFEHCITPSAYTLPSHASIMTGLYPPAHGVRLNGDAALGDSQTTLAERLSADGYRTGAFVGAFVLDGRWGLRQGFDHYDDHFQLGPDQRLDLARVQRPANQVVDAALQWLDEDRSKPFFAWLHFYDPHTPYEPPEPFKSQFAGRGPNAMYDGEIAFADSQVGRLLAWLREKGLAENTIVIVTSDHGEGLGSHGESEHGYYIYDYAVRVPLIIRGAGMAPARVTRQVRTIDLFPTILDLVSIGESAKVEGESLLPLITGSEPKERTRYAYSESMATRLQYGWSALYSVRTNAHKYIAAPRSELYDLRDDPGETRNRLDDERRVVLQLRRELTSIREEGEKRAPKAQEANLDDETLRKLASLGYLGGGSSTLRGEDKDLADPKDKLHLFDSVGYAANLISKDDYKQAAEVLEIVLGDDPHVPQAQLLLVSAYRKIGRTADARAILDRQLKEDASNPRALIAMAEILAGEGKTEDMLAICRQALAVDENNARAWELMAEIHMARNDHRGAQPLLRRVVEIQPKLTRSRNNLAASLIATGDLPEAERLLQEILGQYPKFPNAHFHLALMRERQGRLRDARAAYETELKNHPQSFVARFNLGDLLLRTGDARGAEEQMRMLIQQDPGNARPYLMLARLLMDRPGRLPEVEQLAQAGLSRTEDADLKALGYFLLADVYSREGRRNELQDALRKGEHYRALVRS
ncbi:MAG TPA: sulfatase-like hydrolase/transferase [Thermoanaerobaculia bacterium]|nr:sulfatase-like hydrolase/transferase [Thermoanaerobaculia bacterium]